MLKKKNLQLLIALLLPAFMMAQVTTSSITGVVKAGTEPLVGATITAKHLPTGTVYTVQTRTGGRYDIPNVNPGGPYTVTASFINFENGKQDDIYLSLGETSSLDFELKSAAAELTNVLVTGTRAARLSGKGGVETNIGRDKVANLPTVGRNLNDYIRLTPQVKITANGGFGLAGQNNRYNSFMIDGAVNNDVFGLSESGTNGGRSGATPISIDAIDQFAVQLSPYDVSLGNFTGGGINATTRSGSNEFKGSVYYFYRNQDLAGKTPTGEKSAATKLVDFSNKTFGFRVGGAIVKNKFFYFLNLERQDDNRPQPADLNRYEGNYFKNDSLTILVNHLKSKYNYDPGDFINNPDQIKATRLASRFDWNISSKNQLTFSYRYTKAERTNPPRSSNMAINFVNSAEFFPSTQHSGNIELNSRFTSRTNNKLRVSLTRVVDDRAVTGTPFPYVTIRDATNTNINFGSEISSGANLLKQTIINLYDAFQYYSGKHNFKAGFDIDIANSYNLFLNRSFGAYEYATIADFINNGNILRYRRGYSLNDDPKVTGDQSLKAAASFKSWRLGLFLNDDIRFNNNFTLTLGVRVDRTAFLTDVPTDRFFNDSALPVLSQYYDLKGAKSGEMFKPAFVFSPRTGFVYKIPEEGVTLRGGIGVFTGRTPLVWPGGLYQNNGITGGVIDQRNVRTGFRSDIANQYTVADFGSTARIPQGDMNIIEKNYRLPSVVRTSLGVDKRIGSGWSFTFDAIYTKNINEANWRNLAFDPALTKSTGVGVRDIYSATGFPVNLILRPTGASSADRSPYTNIILLENTDNNKGYSYSFTAGVDKIFQNGFSFSVNYTYGDAYINNEATSSINTSNWQNMEAVSGRNNNVRSKSDFSIGHRITSYISKKFTYAKGALATTITLFYNGQSGSPYSYVYGNDRNLNGSISGDGVSFNDLIYIPTSTEINSMLFLDNTVGTAPNTVTYTVAQQKAALEAFISGDNYLKKHRGEFAERNGARAPFTNVIDLKLAQDINFKVGKKVYSFQLTWDVFNFTNLLNRNWGRQYFFNFDQQALITWAGYSGTEPRFKFTPNPVIGTVSDGVNPFNTSRWTSQVGIRFNF